MLADGAALDGHLASQRARPRVPEELLKGNTLEMRLARLGLPFEKAVLVARIIEHGQVRGVGWLRGRRPTGRGCSCNDLRTAPFQLSCVSV
jgi:hypothetical protein